MLVSALPLPQLPSPKPTGLDGARGLARHGGTLRDFGDLGSSIITPPPLGLTGPTCPWEHPYVHPCSWEGGGDTGGAQAWPGRLWVPWDRALRKV